MENNDYIGHVERQVRTSVNVGSASVEILDSEVNSYILALRVVATQQK